MLALRLIRLVCFASTLVLVACASAPPHAARPMPSLIPLPATIELSPGALTLREGAVLAVRSPDAEAVGVARHFSALLARTHGIHLDVRPFGGSEPDDAIAFVLDPRMLVRGDDGDEGYELTVASHRIVVAARTPHGLFDGSMTLWQLLTQGPERAASLEVPCLHIEDRPRFAWRGVMLDSARHYQTPAEIERLLEQMAEHKLDVFHWHLTDDQGWRIQIKKYPRLTEVGAWRTPATLGHPGARYGGYYTQDDIREIVRYARERYITVVPEIEMPGHAQAAIAAYPELGARGDAPEVSHDWGVHTYLYNVDEATFGFLEDVLGEVMELFPGPYIHVGGDEAAKDQWRASPRVQQRMRELGIKDEAALQGWFTARIETFLAAHGRKLVGWDEILEGGVPPRATVMSWRGTQGGIDAARSGHDVVMAPSPLLYFDHVQSALHDEPPGRPDVVSLADVYAFDALPPGLDAGQTRHILGAQANLWSEYLDSDERLEHAVFPRAAALAEALWTPAARRDWRGFLARMPAEFARLRAQDIAAADSAFGVRIDARGPQSTQVELSDQARYGDIRYATGDAMPTPTATLYSAPMRLDAPRVSAASFAGTSMLSAPRTRALDPVSLAQRSSDELGSCTPGQGLPLRLPGPAIDGGAGVYRVDLFDPCWIYAGVNLGRGAELDVSAAARPYNFQLWTDATKVVLRPPTSPHGELEVHLDTCAGELLASVPLPDAAERDTAKFAVSLPARTGTRDLCLTFTRRTWNPLWMVDSATLLQR
ncbi:MAG TPA: family 20 glycosylhydrolase [Rudaea sp.]|nr:family 20 glycosylhydrolase [Rudaea sp.]